MTNERFPHWRPPEFDARGMTKWNWMCQHPENLRLAEGTDIGAFCYINAARGVTIGAGAQLGSHCSVYSVSTIDDKTGPVVIGECAKIGSHCTVMPGVSIGAGAVIGAHSFVTQDIPPGATAWGVPARVVAKAKPI